MKENSKELIHQLAKLDGLLRRTLGRAGHGGGHNPHRGQGRVLSILKLQPKMSQRELSYLLDMRKQSLGELLAKLEARGLINRTQSEDDRRAMMIELTETGREAAQALEDEKDEGQDFFAALSEEEQAQLGGYLARLIEDLEKQVGEMDGGDPRFADERFRPMHHGHHHGPRSPEGCGRGCGHRGPHGHRGPGRERGPWHEAPEGPGDEE